MLPIAIMFRSIAKKSVLIYPRTLSFANRQERVATPHYTIIILYRRKECTPALLAPRQKRVYPHIKVLNIHWKERVHPCTLGSLLLTGKKECIPTLKCSCILIYTGKKECTPTLFSASITPLCTLALF